MSLNIVDESIIQKIGYLRELKFELEAEDRSLKHWGVSPHDSQAKEVGEDVDFYCSLSQWYTAKVDEIHAAIETPKSEICPHCGVTHGPAQRFDPVWRLRELARSGGPDYRLREWVRWLRQREMLPADFAIDLTPPVNEAKLAREKAAREAEQKFQNGYDQLRQAVREHANPPEHWGYADSKFLQTWNHTQFSRDDRGLYSFAKALSEAGLLPLGWRAFRTLGEFFAKIKEGFKNEKQPA